MFRISENLMQLTKIYLKLVLKRFNLKIVYSNSFKPDTGDVVYSFIVLNSNVHIRI